MSERLEEIKELLRVTLEEVRGNRAVLIKRTDLVEVEDLIIEQAERVEESESQIRKEYRHKMTYRKVALRYQKDIKRCREALVFYADELTYTDKQRTSRGDLVNTGYLNIMTDKGQRARRELERDSE